MTRSIGIPRPSLSRLPLYYRRLLRSIEHGETVISSHELGIAANVPAAQVRKDLSHLGELGRAGVGYDTQHLAATLQTFLGLANDKEAILVGAGNLGRALAGYPGFSRYGLKIVALFDTDPVKVGTSVSGIEIFPLSKLKDLSERLHIKMGIIAVPAKEAQTVADRMVEAGIEVIWNFAPRRVVVPEGILTENEDLAARLATISYHITRRKLLD